MHKDGRVTAEDPIINYSIYIIHESWMQDLEIKVERNLGDNENSDASLAG
jgi:hypothetical protein